MLEYRIMIERSDAKLPGKVRLTMDYESACRLYEFVKREMEDKSEYYRYAAMGKGTPPSVVANLKRDKDAFEVIYKGVVEAYLSREDA